MNRTCRLPRFLLVTTAFVAAATLSGCDRSPSSPGGSSGGPSDRSHDHASESSHGHGGSHGHEEGHHHGPTTELGEATVAALTIRASRDGDIVPGGDAPIDLWITGEGPRVRTVRFWIGTADGRGSVRARAELEHDHYHSHAEVPDPLPPGSELWVEIETETGERLLVSFDLKM